MVATTDLSKQEDRNSGFEIKQETVTVTVFSKAGRGFLKKKRLMHEKNWRLTSVFTKTTNECFH